VAQQKISQTDAQYQGTPKDDRHCDGCINFQPPNACKFVQGDIKPSGWRQLFLRRRSPGCRSHFSGAVPE
jgi:hypothetical protein